MSKNTTKPARIKPSKPYPEFPLFPHASGYWAKKIRGRTCYFGPWDDHKAALDLYLKQRDDLYAGRKPREITECGLTVMELANRFLTSKQRLLESRELSPRTFDDYHATCERLINAFGKVRMVEDLRADDFEELRAAMAKTRGPVALGNEIQRMRVVFKYAFDSHLITAPVKYGPTFRKPSKKVLLKARNEQGERMIDPPDLHRIMAASSVHMKAMILLGLNCGFGNNDCGMLPLKAFDSKRQWVTFPRPKTSILRRIPLWPETATALDEAIEARKLPTDEADNGLVFVTKYGVSWSKQNANNPISAEFRKLVVRLGLYRPGISFYTLRHIFETIGGESRDQVAVDAIMGHSDGSMGANYRQRISDERLIAVVETVRKWLFKPEAITDSGTGNSPKESVSSEERAQSG